MKGAGFDVWFQRVVSTCLLILAVLVTARVLGLPAQRYDAIPILAEEAWLNMLDGRHSHGDENAPVVVASFSDFTCPACRVLLEHVRTMQRDHPGMIRYVHLHAPISATPLGRRTAVASECAALEGSFWPYHDALYSNQRTLSEAGLIALAETTGNVDLSRFRACLERDATPEIRRDSLAALEIGGVTGTPTFLLNGRLVRGAPPFAEFRQMVLEAFERAS